ncbi:MAG TPA: C4-type zinc ribbon domain-containing protein [Pirellulaceae bacterium]
MTIDQAGLRQLHHVHQRLEDLRSRMARGPMQIKAMEAKVARQEEELKTQQDQNKRHKLNQADRELQLKERENRIHDYRGKLNSCSSNKEYQALMERIAADEQANSVLSDEILELMDKVIAVTEVIVASRATLEKSQGELEALRQRVAAERAILEVDVGAMEARLREAELILPADARPGYDRVVKAHGADALAVIEEGTCGGCSQTVTPQMINELRMSRLVACKNCGRLLYLPE